MREVAIIGAGELGGAVAHLVARRDLARTVRLIDEAGSIAAGKALDIAQAAPSERFAAQLSGSTDVSSAAGAAVIVVADRARGGEWQGEDGLALVRRLAQMAPAAAIVCAGASQREMIDRGVRESQLSRARIFGSAPEALAAGARALVALAVNGSPRDVTLAVLGAPPGHTVVAWEDATIAGYALTRSIDEPTRRRIAARVAALWPPGPYALGAAAAAAIDAISGRSRRIMTCFVGPDTSAGIRMRATALPVRLGAAGISDVVMPVLSAVEQLGLDNAMRL